MRMLDSPLATDAESNGAAEGTNDSAAAGQEAASMRRLVVNINLLK